jgi:hypothetical protein
MAGIQRASGGEALSGSDANHFCNSSAGMSVRRPNFFVLIFPRRISS